MPARLFDSGEYACTQSYRRRRADFNWVLASPSLANMPLNDPAAALRGRAVWRVDVRRDPVRLLMWNSRV